MFKNKYLNFIYSLVTVLIVAGLNSYFNQVGMLLFYDKIELSPLTPPDYVFPIVWGFLYILLILSYDMILGHPDKKQVWIAAQMFLVNMFLQVLWCFMFFFEAYFMVAFAVLVVLVFSTIYLMQRFYYLKPAAAYMLVPYLLWLIFAAYLNWVVVDLNGPNYIF